LRTIIGVKQMGTKARKITINIITIPAESPFALEIHEEEMVAGSS